MKKAILTFLILAGSLFAQNVDVIIPGQTNAYLNIVQGKAWGSLNANYVFSPITTDSTICVYIANNNPTNAHTVTLALNSTGDTSVNNFANNPLPWVGVPIINVSFPVSVAANATNAYFFKSQAAAKLALIVTGATTAAGSPDTANINVVQPSTSSTCGAAPNATSLSAVIGPTGVGNTIASGVNAPVIVGGINGAGGGTTNVATDVAVDNVSHGFWVGVNNNGPPLDSVGTQLPLQFLNGIFTASNAAMSVESFGVNSDTNTGWNVTRNSLVGTATSNAWQWSSANESGGSHAAFFAEQDAVNPGAGFDLLDITLSSGVMRPNRVTVSCSAVCDVLIKRITASGTTCSTGTVVQAWDPALGGATHATVHFGCTGAATVNSVMMHLFLSANTAQTVDLNGYWEQTALWGFDVVEGAAVAAGTVTVNMEWQER